MPTRSGGLLPGTAFRDRSPAAAGCLTERAPAAAGALVGVAITFALAAAVLGAAPEPARPTGGRVPDAPVARYADGAPPGFSGGFGEQSCHACHFHAPVNTGPGRVALAGIPGRFVGGQEYAVTVTVSRPGMAIAGFQLTARFARDGSQAGRLAPGPDEAERIRIEVQDGVQYANQRRAGTPLQASGVTRWTLLWTAPQSGAVVFHVAANAGDNDESAQGDDVYVATAETTAQGAGPADPSIR